MTNRRPYREIAVRDQQHISSLRAPIAVAVKREGDDDEVYELTGGTGSRRYMAPEVCLRNNYGTKVDVYSWAIAARDSVRPAPLYAIAATHRSIPIAGLGDLES